MENPRDRGKYHGTEDFHYVNYSRYDRISIGEKYIENVKEITKLSGVGFFAYWFVSSISSLSIGLGFRLFIEFGRVVGYRIGA